MAQGSTPMRGAFPIGFRGRGRCDDSMLYLVARLAIAAPRRILTVAALGMVALGIFGVPVAKSLSASGLQDPDSESARATQLLADKFGQGDVSLLIVVSAPDGVESSAARATGTDIVDQLRRSQ